MIVLHVNINAFKTIDNKNPIVKKKTLKPTLTFFLLVAKPTVASIFSLVCGWKRAGSVEMYSVRRSHETLTWWCRDRLASWQHTHAHKNTDIDIDMKVNNCFGN